MPISTHIFDVSTPEQALATQSNLLKLASYINSAINKKIHKLLKEENSAVTLKEWQAKLENLTKQTEVILYLAEAAGKLFDEENKPIEKDFEAAFYSVIENLVPDFMKYWNAYVDKGGEVVVADGPPVTTYNGELQNTQLLGGEEESDFV